MHCPRIAVAAVLTAGCLSPAAHAQTVRGAVEPMVSAPGSSRLNELPVQIDALRRFHVTTRGRIVQDEGIPGGGLRGPCSPTVSSHTDANFSGGSFIVEAGMGEMEGFAATYPFTVPAGVQTPAQIKIDLMECILATSNSTVQTTTRYTVSVWVGTPATGTLVWTQTSSDQPGDLPDAVIPPGTNGVNLQVSVDPGDPDQIILTDNGSHQFSIGFFIAHHNQQTANPCTTAPPTCCNAFYTVDTSGRSQPSLNWLFGLNCGSFGCPANGGWATFAALPSFCRPSGDAVMRATWEFINCQTVLGSCCTGGNCTIATQSACTSGGGTYRGDNTDCGTPCPVPTGSCCTGGTCTIVSQATCTSGGGSYRGDNTTCANPCPVPQGACCFNSNSCLFLTQSDCAQIPGSWQSGVQCGPNNTCPQGACCLSNGNCITTTSSGCQVAQGTFQGVGSTCGGTNCPQPTGACCTSSGGCLVLTQANCNLISGAAWAGANTSCPGACCRPDWDHNGQLQPADVAAFVTTWFGSLQNGNLNGDYDSNGVVNPADVSTFVSDWFNRVAAGGC